MLEAAFEHLGLGQFDASDGFDRVHEQPGQFEFVLSHAVLLAVVQV
jgi:hypothetical protein